MKRRLKLSERQLRQMLRKSIYSMIRYCNPGCNHSQAKHEAKKKEIEQWKKRTPEVVAKLQEEAGKYGFAVEERYQLAMKGEFHAIPAI